MLLGSTLSSTIGGSVAFATEVPPLKQLKAEADLALTNLTQVHQQK